MNVALKTCGILGMAILYSVTNAQTTSGVPFPSEAFGTKAVFELEVSSSSVLKLGPSNITTVSAFVTIITKGLLGYSQGLEVRFFTKPLSEVLVTDSINDRANKFTASDHATLILFLGKDKQVEQVNLSYVIPGTTVARTVAWKPEELEKYFSNCTFDGKRLILKSKGSYSDKESERERITLSWNVDLDLPVFSEVKK